MMTMRALYTCLIAGFYLATAGNADAQQSPINNPWAHANQAPYVLAQSGSAITVPADTSEDVLATVTVPANSMGANGCLTVVAVWSYTNSANTKTALVRFSGASGTVFLSTSPTTTASINTQLEICNRNSTSSQVGHAFNSVGPGATTTSPATASVDTTAATTVVISAQKASAGETMTLESYSVRVWPNP